MEGKKLTVLKASKLVGVHRNTIRYWMKQGKVKYEVQPLSGLTLVEKESLLEFARQRGIEVEE